MPGTYSGYVGVSTGDTTRLPSAALWHQVDAELTRPGMWFGEFEDFVNYDATEAAIPTTEDPFLGNFVFSSTGGLFTKVDDESGVRTLGSDGDDEGSTVRSGTYPYKMIRSAGELVFEACFKTTTIADTKHNILFGLIEDVPMTAIIPITAAGAIADRNMVGIRRTETALRGSKLDTVYKADTIAAVTVQTDAFTLVADTFTRAGFVFNRKGDNRLRFYFNGIEAVNTKEIPTAVGNDFPNDIRLGWFFAVLNATGTTPGSVNLDWVRVAQRRVA